MWKETVNQGDIFDSTKTQSYFLAPPKTELTDKKSSTVCHQKLKYF